MAHCIQYQRIIATKQRAEGNAEVGTSWTETKSFPADTPVYKVIEWSEQQGRGRLEITIDHTDSEYHDYDNFLPL